MLLYTFTVVIVGFANLNKLELSYFGVNFSRLTHAPRPLGGHLLDLYLVLTLLSSIP